MGNVSSHDPNGISVTVWAGNTKDDSVDDRRLHIAGGIQQVISGTTRVGHDQKLPIGFKTATAPAVACQLNFDGESDCLIVFVPLDNPDNQVHALPVRIFTSINDSSYDWAATVTNAIPIADSSTGSKAQSAERPALLWNNDKFIMVIRSSKSLQGLQAFESSDGVTWSLSASLGESSIPPQVQTSLPDLTVTKLITYAR